MKLLLIAGLFFASAMAANPHVLEKKASTWQCDHTNCRGKNEEYCVSVQLGKAEWITVRVPTIQSRGACINGYFKTRRKTNVMSWIPKMYVDVPVVKGEERADLTMRMHTLIIIFHTTACLREYTLIHATFAVMTLTWTLERIYSVAKDTSRPERAEVEVVETRALNRCMKFPKGFRLGRLRAGVFSVMIWTIGRTRRRDCG
ncbi:hypothetical protein K440DRAFT_642521 [Wilcoxina mikolae CBS 423.85]|nr:hypothetical protein K440DRAFT_642521 [Wilcoxina mikolae CBS 423.85]